MAFLENLNCRRPFNNDFGPMCYIDVIQTKKNIFFWAQDDAKICQTTTQVLAVLSDMKLENTNLHLYNLDIKGQNFFVLYSESTSSRGCVLTHVPLFLLVRTSSHPCTAHLFIFE